MDRRTYLSVVGAGLSGLGGCSRLSEERDPGTEPPGPTESTSTHPPPTTTTGGGATSTPDPFDREVDVVEDLGCDPTGSDPCNQELTSSLEDGTLLRFPEGTYQFDDQVTLMGLPSVGFVGEGGAKFVPPEGFNQRLLTVHADTIVFEGIDVGVTADRTTAGFTFVAEDRFRVEDVQFRGRGSHPDSQVVNALGLGVRNPDGKGLVRNVVAKKGSSIGHYKNGNGRVGTWIGQLHRGTIRIEDCHYQEFGNNGIYASRTRGDVEVVDSTFRNNNVTSIRISGRGSFVRNADIEVDLRKYDGPRTGLSDQFNTRGISIEQNNVDKPPGAKVLDSDVRIKNTPLAQTAIGIGHYGKSATIRNTEITGAASDNSAIRIEGAPGSVLRNCSVEQDGSNRNGIHLTDSRGTLVDGGTVETTGFPLLVGVEDGATCLFRVGNTPRLRAFELDLLGTGSALRAELPTAVRYRCVDPNLLGEFDPTEIERIGVVRAANGILFFHRLP
jgi:hypothetical protein